MKNLMKSIIISKRSKAIIFIIFVAISLGAISKKVIRYPKGGCMGGGQELTFKKGIIKFLI